MKITISNEGESVDVSLGRDECLWIIELLTKIKPSSPPMNIGAVKTDLGHTYENFEMFWFQDQFKKYVK